MQSPLRMGNVESASKLTVHFTDPRCRHHLLHAIDAKSPVDDAKSPVDDHITQAEEPDLEQHDEPGNSIVEKILNAHLPPTACPGKWLMEISVRQCSNIAMAERLSSIPLV